jgi:hypothetical protein
LVDLPAPVAIVLVGLLTKGEVFAVADHGQHVRDGGVRIDLRPRGKVGQVEPLIHAVELA